ncbi:hypothetical protein EEB14_11590 [Rhodococcus sp. WS4]|nr:hypothetical protein EEB14_11590 [Rhodococcus sp. WS4]
MSVGTHPTFENSPSGRVLTSPPDGSAVDRATGAARRVIDALLRTDRGNANLDRVAEELNSIAEHLEEHAPAVAERLVQGWRCGDPVFRWVGRGVPEYREMTDSEKAALEQEFHTHGRQRFLHV